MNAKQQGTLLGGRAESDSTFKKQEKTSYLGDRGGKENQWCGTSTGDHTGLEQELQMLSIN